MPLRVGIYLAEAERTERFAQRFPLRLGRVLRAEERGGALDDSALLAAKVAVLKAVGQISIFRSTSFAITRVRGGLAAIPRERCFENRLVGIGASWVSVSCGVAHGIVWSLAVTLPGDVPDFDAAVVLRTVSQTLTEEDRLDRASLEEVGRSHNPEVSRAARHAAASAAEMLFNLRLPQVGIAVAEDRVASFTAPSILTEVPVSIAHQGYYVAGAVAKEARQRRLRIDQGSALLRAEIQ